MMAPVCIGGFAASCVGSRNNSPVPKQVCTINTYDACHKGEEQGLVYTHSELDDGYGWRIFLDDSYQ